MSRPLSPLSSSKWNMRSVSPDSPPPTARRRGIDEINGGDNDKENQSPNSAKRPVYDVEGGSGEILQSLPSREVSYVAIDVDVDEDLIENPPSSPFQYDPMNTTSDLGQKLREGSRSPPSMDISISPKRIRGNECQPSHHLDSIAITPKEEPEKLSHEDRQDCEVEAGDASIVHRELPTENNSVVDDRHNEEMSTVCQEDDPPKDNSIISDRGGKATIPDIHDPMDDTCLSTFSAVPDVDMTPFAKLRASPTKQFQGPIGSPEPILKGSPSRGLGPMTPLTSRKTGSKGSNLFDVDSPVISQSSCKRGSHNDATNLLEFTDHLNYFSHVSQRYAAQSGRTSSPHHRSPLKAARESLRTPGKFSLLDFDIPPAPTPRSIPTITPRELESLKSGFLSEISSLKATLSGKEAEVGSLKQAVADAERRVGEASETVRNEVARREALEVEQAVWERRGAEMESILRGVKAEILEGEQERELLTKRLEDADKRREQFEGRNVELETQLSAARKTGTSIQAALPENKSRNMKTAEEVAREVQDAVEKVARELHSLYKGKHETKVAALKKSYGARWEKRVREAESQLKEAIGENERLKAERDTTMSEPMNPNASILARENDEHEAEKRVLEAQIKGLQQEMTVIKQDNERLHSELKMERTEKGELVAAVDEWLAVQQIQNQAPKALEGTMQAQPQEYITAETESVSTAPETENFSRSLIGRGGTSGIRPPSSGRGGRLGGVYGNGHARANSGSGRSAGRSGIMNSIERMGRGSN